MLAGMSGSGKTTLLRQISGNVGWQGDEKGTLISRAERSAYVWQNPEGQIVTDRTEYELVFGLENVGMPGEQMQRRLAEMVTFFGMESMLGKSTMALSGGEMQTLNVAASVAMNPDLLLLDEPTSQLDPVASKKIIELLRQINEELGITILIAEQRLEDVLLLADKMFFMENGEITAEGSPLEIWEGMPDHLRADFFPAYAGLAWKYGKNKTLLLSPKEARNWFENSYEPKAVLPEKAQNDNQIEKKMEEMIAKDIFFRYEKKNSDVLRECSFSFPYNEIICISGGNGSGKTTLLEVLAGRYRIYRGRIKNLPKQVAVLPQQPRYLFIEDTLKQVFDSNKKIRELAEYFGIDGLAERHPADLSGGELQRLGLCRTLAEEAACYLLDEPTQGLDTANKRLLGEYLKNMTQAGKTVIMVSHDMEFAAAYAHKMALMFKGNIVVVADTRSFFEDNQFYTTGINRIARGVSRHIITEEDIVCYAEKKNC